MIRSGHDSLAAWWLLAILCWQLVGSVAAQDESAALRFTHLSVDAPLVDVLVNGQAVLTDVAFGDVTSYLILSVGRHEVVVYPHRLPERRSSPPAADGDAGASSSADNGSAERPRTPTRVLEPIVTFVTVEGGAYYTAMLTGFYEPPAEEGELGHLSIALRPDGTMMGVSGPRGYSAAFTGDQLLTGIQPGTYTVSAEHEGYLSVTYEVEVHARNTSTVSITLQEGEQEVDAAPEIIQHDQTPNVWRSLELHTVRDSLGSIPLPGTARVRVIHAAPTTLPLRVVATPVAYEESQEEEEAADAADADGEQANVDGETEVEAPQQPTEIGTVGYPGASSYATVAAGTYSISYFVSDTEQVALVLADMDLVAGAVYTFYLKSDAAGRQMQVLVTVDAIVGLQVLGR